jgi:hypothetical protein
MAEFKIEIAGHTAAVSSLYDSSRDYCRDYWTEKCPEFAIQVTREDLVFEQADLDREAAEDGFRRRVFTDPFLDRAAIQRKMADYLIRRNVLMIHGSAIAVDGRGYLFMAKSGTGKSTHTRLWREVFGSRARMVNDDKPFLSLEQDTPMLCGAPWSGKHGLHSNICVPLAGICILERGEENRIWSIPAQDAMSMLLHQSYCPPEEARQQQALLDRLAAVTPLWRMRCNREKDTASTAFFAMSGPPS